MCTVTFIPDGNAVYITHNRDEKCVRPKAVPPQQYTENGHTLLFPKDSQAGGSWIALNENGSAAVLLNGAFVKHQSMPPYRKSRGLCFLEIAGSSDMKEAYERIDLAGIEPFTVILYQDKQLFQCRWDGNQKHILPLDASVPHIWSSVTLYDPEIISRRKTWFDSWLANNRYPSWEEIIGFHLSAGEGDLHNDLRMNRNGSMLTVSVTAMKITPYTGHVKYQDLQDNTSHDKEIEFSAVNASVEET